MWKNRDERPRPIMKEFNSLQRVSYAQSRVDDFSSKSGPSLNNQNQAEQTSFDNIGLLKKDLYEQEVEFHQNSIEKSGEVYSCLIN